MDEGIARTIRGISRWEDIQQFRENALEKGKLTAEIQAALNARAVELGRALIERFINIPAAPTPAELGVIAAVSAYAGLKKAQGSNAYGTFRQINNRGLLGAAEHSVCRGSPTEGFVELSEADRSDILYEQIVVDHPDEFSERAIWYSRRALGLPNVSAKPPADEDGDTQSKTTAAVLWLKQAARGNDGLLPRFTNEELAQVMGSPDIKRSGRNRGNIQSRIDFACYRSGLPPLGLAADRPFSNAWAQQGRSWGFPVAEMRHAAKSRAWTDDEFDRLLREAERLAGKASMLWDEALSGDEESVRGWAFGFGSRTEEPEPGPAVDEGPEDKANPVWSRDELILALDLYVKTRASPLAKKAPEILELSHVLNALGAMLGQQDTPTYRNAAGVYMKLMNFRRHDPQFISDGRKGLPKGNKDEVRVWEQFAHDPENLASVAQFIRARIDSHQGDNSLAGPDEPGVEEAEEGKVATREHRYRERDRRLVKEAKAAAMRKHGVLCCAACKFNFSDRYGAIGIDIIDVHHTKPIHTMQPGEKTKVSDLVLLCSNCHRVVHSRRQWLTVEQLRAALIGPA